jgi:hypothetical protein
MPKVEFYLRNKNPLTKYRENTLYLKGRQECMDVTIFNISVSKQMITVHGKFLKKIFT